MEEYDIYCTRVEYGLDQSYVGEKQKIRKQKFRSENLRDV